MTKLQTTLEKLREVLLPLGDPDDPRFQIVVEKGAYAITVFDRHGKPRAVTVVRRP